MFDKDKEIITNFTGDVIFQSREKEESRVLISISLMLEKLELRRELHKLKSLSGLLK